MDNLTLIIAFIGVLGIAAQWLAWRLRLPAIVLLLVAGFLAGPVTGILDPERDFGSLYEPLISLAVAIILFEGGLTLNFREIRETSTAVRRIIVIGGPLIWLMSALSAHFVGGLSISTSAVLGAVLIVTGPTVIMPLLRQAKLSSRPASLLRWEAIVNDPIGALAAVLAFEVILIMNGSHSPSHLAVAIPLALIASFGGGWAAGQFIQWAFIRGLVAEYLKVPVLLVTVLLVYALTNLMLDEAGLLTVTVMGITIANSRIASLTEIKRFKEIITILLVSGVFILLTASLSVGQLRAIDWKIALFVATLLFVIRPVAIFVATTGAGLSWQERLLTGWIAPRGIVAVAVSGLFAASLDGLGVSDGSEMVAVTFLVVVSTILLHGFTMAPLAAFLGLKSAARPGILIVGGSSWSVKFAQCLMDLEVPVMIADRNWNRLIEPRMANVAVYFGEILSEEAHHSINFHDYSFIVAASGSDAYNTLVCTNFGPDIGRSNVFQIAPVKQETSRNVMANTLRGRRFSEPQMTYPDIVRREAEGWNFRVTTLTDEFDHDAFLASQDEKAVMLLRITAAGRIVFVSTSKSKPSKGDRIVTYRPAATGREAS